MKSPMICIKKKLLILALIFSVVFYLVVLFSNNTSLKSLSYKAKAQTGNYCQSIGLYDVPGEDMGSSLKKIYEAKCSTYANYPQWNGKRGNEAQCYTSTAVCGKIPGCIDKNCLARISEEIPCINESVNIQKCLDSGAVTQEQLDVYVCMYAGQVITDTSTPYYYISTGIHPVYKCIQQNGRNIGVRCISDEMGKVIANYNMDDETNCSTTVAPVPTDEPVTPTRYLWDNRGGGM